MFATKGGSLRKALWHKNRNKSEGSDSSAPTPTSTSKDSKTIGTKIIRPQISEPIATTQNEAEFGTPPPRIVATSHSSINSTASDGQEDYDGEAVSPFSDYCPQPLSRSTVSIPEGEALDTTGATTQIPTTNRPQSRLSVKGSLKSRVPPMLAGRMRVRSANPVLGLPSLSLTTPPSSNNNQSPLSLDINCTCASEITKPSTSNDSSKDSYSVLLCASSDSNFTQQPVQCLLHHSASERHQRSNSASPKVLNTTRQLLIPLQENSSVGARNGSLGKRASIASIGRRYSPTFYLSPFYDQPTVFDFEDFHNNLNQNSQECVYSLFMKAHKCYDIIPTSGKVVVFDTELTVSKAFFALVYNGVRAAPLFDSKEQKFVGLLTITDFIMVLNKYYTKGSVSTDIRELEQHKICTWREVFKNNGQLKPFICINPRESLYRAVELLCEHKIHRLPVLETDTGNILYILTHKRIIRFLVLYMSDLPTPDFMKKTPRELGIGCWDNICAISKDTSLIEAMKVFLEKRVSALPLLDEEGRAVDVYAKFDAINLAAEKTYSDLDVSVYEALKHRSDWFEGVRNCSENDTLSEVIDAIVKAEVHRLIVTTDDQRVVGIISLSDILRFLILEPVFSELNNASNVSLLSGVESTNEEIKVNEDNSLAEE